MRRKALAGGYVYGYNQSVAQPNPPSGYPMTIKNLFIHEFGEKEYKELSPRLKKFLGKVDSQASRQKPITPRQLQEALR